MGGAVQSIAGARPADPAARRVAPPSRCPPAPLVKFHAPEVVFGLGLARRGRLLGGPARRPAADGRHRPRHHRGRLGATSCSATCATSRLTPVVWSSVTPNPKDHEIHAAYERYVEEGCDVLDRARRRLLHRRRQGRRDPVRQRRPDPGLRRRRPGRQADPAAADDPEHVRHRRRRLAVLHRHRHGPLGEDHDHGPGAGARHLDHRPAAADDDARVAQRRDRPRRADPRHRGVRLAGAQPARRHPRAQRRRPGVQPTCAPRSCARARRPPAPRWRRPA